MHCAALWRREHGQEPEALNSEAFCTVKNDTACRAATGGRPATAKLPPDADCLPRRGGSRGIALRSVPIHNATASGTERNESDSGEAPVTHTQLTPPTLTQTDNEDEFASCSLPLGGMGNKAKAELEAAEICRPRARLKPVFETDSDFEDSDERKPLKGASKARHQLRSESRSERESTSRGSQSTYGKTRARVETGKHLYSKKMSGKGVDDTEICQSVNRSRTMFDDDDDDFIQERREEEHGVKAGLRRSARKRKLVTDWWANDEISSPPTKRRPAAKNRASPTKKRSPSKAQAKFKNANATDLSIFGESPKRISLKPLELQVGERSGAVGAADDHEQIGSQDAGSQTMDIVVEAMKPRRKKKGRRFAERLYRSLTEDDLSLIRQAFTKVYRTPPSNARVQGCYEFDQGQQMSEAMKKQVWENDLKPWSDRWWQLYQDFGKIGRRIKREKEAKDIKPDLNMRELTKAAKKFREEHGEIQPEKISYIM